MNLTLIFIVLSIAIGYMLYDTFKKSRQQAITTEQSSNSGTKIKTNYTAQCKILKQLHEQKINSIKNKSISIHLKQLINNNQQQYQSNVNKQLENQTIQQITNTINKLNKSIKIYILIKKSSSSQINKNKLIQLLSSLLPVDSFIPYSSIQGAVAILRQLNCNFHLQSQQKLFKIIRQYIPNIWFTGKDQDGYTKYVFKNQVEMFKSLSKLIQVFDINNKNKQQ